jgi:hypothetical protein
MAATRDGAARQVIAAKWCTGKAFDLIDAVIETFAYTQHSQRHERFT